MNDADPPNSPNVSTPSNSLILARAVTNVLNPFVLFTLLFAATAFVGAGFIGGSRYLLVEVLAGALVAGYVLLMRRRRKVGDFWISTRSERLVPAIFLMLCFAGLLAALYLLSVPEDLIRITLSMGLASACVAFVTFFWKASAHCAVAGHTAAAGVLLFGVWGVPFALVLPLVVWARVRLEAHTVLQSLAGVVVGGAFALAFLI